MTLKTAVQTISPQKLVWWLKNQPASRRFYLGEPCNCLIAEYFKDVTNLSVSVNSSEVKNISLGYERFSLPNWVTQLIKLFDISGNSYHLTKKTLSLVQSICQLS